jgi:methylenetetrahydrofolate reductase (NADPH)
LTAGCTKGATYLAGMTPMKSVGMARYMKNKVPGMDVPDEMVDRMAGVPKEKQAEEGIKICVESIERLKEVKGWPVSAHHGHSSGNIK